MSYQIILAVFLACGPIKVYNKTKIWNSEDLKVLRSVEKTCMVKYKSCLKYLIKKEDNIYHAVCGK